MSRGGSGTWRCLVILVAAAFVCGLATAVPASAQIPASERQALIDFYYATGGDSWNDRRNWRNADDTDFNSPGTEGTWLGVGVNPENTHVTSIMIHGNNLNGSLPADLTALTELEHLELYLTQLTTPIPDFSGLTHLKVLGLSTNGLTGEIPQWIGNLSELVVLNLDGNHFTGDIPDNFGDLHNLQYLQFSDMQLAADFLRADGTSWLNGMPNLKWLTARGNQLTGRFPWEIENCTQMDTIWLQGSHLTGPLAHENGDGYFRNMTHLTALEISFNNFNGPIPSDIGNCVELRHLGLDRCGLSGELPSSLGQLTNLVVLASGENGFTGSLPDSLMNLTHLQYLLLPGNHLSGSLPAGIGDFKELKWIWLNGNQFTGSIPTEWGGMTDLEILAVQENHLTGTLPASLGNLKKVWQLVLFNNQIEGPIPPEFGDMTSLYWVWLQNNKFSGPIPPEVGNLKSATSVNLSDNQLSGSIPPELAGMTALVELSLHGNRLSGTIPESLGTLPSLQGIWLDNNALSGEVPSSLMNLSHLADGQSNFVANALHSSDPALSAFLNLKQWAGWPWSHKQTVAPADVAVSAVSSDGVTLTWTPIAFNWGPGSYKVYASADPAGPFTEAGATATKAENGLTVTGLTAGVAYYFLVRTVSLPFEDNPNTVLSDPSAVVSATPAAGNEPPSVEAGPDQSAVLGQSVSLAPATFTDADASDTHTATIAWGDGTVEAGVVSESGGSGTVSGSHVYGSAGTFTVAVTIEDNSGASASDTLSVNVGAAPVGIPPAERNALIAIYNSTNGASWSNRTNWLGPPGTEGTWYGVALNEEQTHVVILCLGWNNLSGTLPPELGDLTELRTLILSPGQISGPVPASLANLHQMRYLDLNWNRFSGEISTIVAAMPLLEDLRVLNNRFTGEILSAVLGAPNLRLLLVAGNQFTGQIPPALGNLTMLQEMWLGNNQFSGPIPASLGQLPGLWKLQLNNNLLTGIIPAELGQATALTDLVLGNNPTMDPEPIPPTFEALNKLTYLDLQKMNLTGQVPSFLLNHPALQYLYLQNNHLTAPLPPVEIVVGAMLRINLQGNVLVGEVPSSFMNFVNLENGNSNFRYNGLFTSDSALDAFLVQKQSGGNWTSTQTVVPTNVAVGGVTSESVTVTWTPIAYTANSGGYRLWFATSPEGPFTAANTTVNKSVTYKIRAYLTPGTTYYLKVQTITYAHSQNINQVQSLFSPLVTATTLLVNNTPVVSAGSDQTVTPGQSVSLAPATFTDADVADIHQAAIDWGDGTAEAGAVTESGGAGSVAGDHLYANDGTYTVTVTVTDIAGATGTDTLLVTVGEPPVIPQTERDILIAFYNSTGGSGWVHKANWLGPAGTEGTWFGVTLSVDGRHVVSIVLNDNNLTGTLPESLGDLVDLEVLEVGGNHLGGHLPHGLGRLNKLKRLILSGSLSGGIPVEWGGMISLEWLDLGGCGVGGGLPVEICALVRLKVLVLSFNGLTGPIPDQLGNLVDLETLELHGNSWSGALPPGLGNLIKLKRLILSGALLTGTIPAAWGGMVSLEWFDIHDTGIGGTLPVEFYALVHMRVLILSRNQFSGPVPVQLSIFVDLEVLELDGNLFTGALPPGLGGLNKLKKLVITGSFTGSIPAEWSGMVSLEWLDIHGSGLSGPLPVEIFVLVKLKVLVLSGNHFTWPVPAQIGGLVSLEVLDLRDNRLDGSLPVAVSLLIHIREIYLGGNLFEGTIPVEWGVLIQLQVLDLHGNRLTGAIPVEVGLLVNLRILLLSYNGFTGEIPTSLLNLTSLEPLQSNFAGNALVVLDVNLAVFLNTKCDGGAWDAMQTVPPTNVAAGAVTRFSVVLNWTAISFYQGSGGYRVFMSTDPAGPFTLVSSTASKSDQTITVSGLLPGTTYYFVIRSFTDPTESNPNTVVSDPTAPVSATTLPGNVSPAVEAGPNQTLTEGAAVSLAPATFTDGDPGDTHTAVIHWGDGSSTTGAVSESSGVGTVAGTHTYADQGTLTVTVTVTDIYGASSSDSFTVTAANVAPVLGPITATMDPVQVQTSATASASFTDAGSGDTHAALWAWGDGSTSAGAVNETGGAGNVTGSHAYAQAGIYTVGLTLTDDDGGSASGFFQFVVVYDPNGGFVTGGGWIDSPAGACPADPSLTGRASFGFVSKYQHGASVPTGTTEFQFKVANLNFHSESYEWLVIAGAKAKYKGEGTINGSGLYGFMISATDGQVNGGGGVDKFRMKIWDKASGTVVYDNQMGTGDDADPVTALGGGSIVIHKD